MYTLRFAMRTADQDPGHRADLYAATLEMCSWAETRGATSIAVSQHHASEDGYLPSPLPMAAAIAARTTTVPVMVAALLLAFYEPVKLAEDIAVIDLLSRGRVSYVVGIGYRQAEFDLFGVDRRSRAALVEERIPLIKGLLAGRTVSVGGREVAITPPPFTPGGPLIAYGGGTEAAARRAGRLGMLFIAETSDPSLEVYYLEEAATHGQTPQGCFFPPSGVPLTLFVAEDPDRAWAEIGSYLLRDAVGYGEWNRHRTHTASISFATSVDELRAERGQYQIVTPDEARAMIAQGGQLALQPLVGGLPPELAWPYLEAAAAASGA
jgi:alkanesulfonate monooxygenase SsuD/methylene tetrahydromethanopterin reductase-like flavin-dependent oxidoreductase (luciferase family)